MKPNKASHAYHLARVAEAKKQPQQALDNLQTYLDEHGTSAGIAPYKMLMRLLTELGQQDKIVERLEAIVAAEPKNTTYARPWPGPRLPRIRTTKRKRFTRNCSKGNRTKTPTWV